MLPEIALTLGATTTVQTKMPFTMYFASLPEIATQDVVEDMTYDPRQQLSTIDDNVFLVKNAGGRSTSRCTKVSATTSAFIGRDDDTDTQTDD